MKVETKDLEQGEKLLTITIFVDEQQDYLNRAAKILSEQKPIDGFRPGKASREVVEKAHGAMAVLEKAIDEIITNTYYQALKQEKILSIGQPKIEIKKMVPDNDIEYTAQVALLPEVTVGDVNKVKVNRSEVKIEDKEINQIIKDLQKMRVKEQLVSRAVKSGDKVEIDFEVKIDNVVIEGGSAKKYPLVIGDKMFIPGFEENVVGMKKDETKKFKLKMPADYKPDLAGKEADFEVKLLSVFERILPKIDDELAKQAGNYKNLGELKEQVKKNLQTDKTAKADQKFEVEILEKLMELSEISQIPKVLIDNEKRKMKHELEENLSGQGINLKQYLDRINKTEEDLHKEWDQPAIKRVKTALIARKFAEDNKVEASQKEVEQEIEKMKEQHKGQPEVEENLKSDSFKDYIFHTLTNRKVIDLLKEKVSD